MEDRNGPGCFTWHDEKNKWEFHVHDNAFHVPENQFRVPEKGFYVPVIQFHVPEKAVPGT